MKSTYYHLERAGSYTALGGIIAWVVFIITIAVGSLIGWVLNIVWMFGNLTFNDSLTAEELLSLAGTILYPLGAIMGWLH